MAIGVPGQSLKDVAAAYNPGTDCMPRPVLHVAPFLWSGAGRVITRLCQDQQCRRPVTLVTTGVSGELRDWPSYRRLLARSGVRHRRLDVFHRDPDRFWAGVVRLTDVIRELDPAVIHAHAGVPTAIAAIARQRAGSRARLVAQMYSWGVGRPSWMDVQDAWAFRQADRVVCSAQAYRALLVAHGVPSRRLAYLPWGLDLTALPCRGPALPDGPPTIGFVGRIEARKGQAALVDAFAQLRRHRPDVRLELVGPVAEPAYADQVHDAVRAHRLDDAVTLRGQVRDVAAIVRRWRLFVSLSSDEGQGLAVLEAMALGVPVVARSVAGIEDFLVDGRTGWAVSGTSPGSAAAVMRTALEAPAAAVTGRARRLVERRYDWAGMLHAFDRLYGA